MRKISIIVLVLAAAYLGFNFYRNQPKAPVAASSTPAPATPEVVAATPPPVQETPAQTAVAKVQIPDGTPKKKRFAPPGIFYMLQRSSIETPTGIRAVVPGEQVRLLKRMGNGMMQLTDGQTNFTVKESAVTNDLDLAEEAKRKESMSSGQPPKP